MRVLLFLLVWLSVTQSGDCQFTAKHAMVYRNVTYEVFLIQMDSVAGRHFSIAENPNLLREGELLGGANHTSMYFAITASITDTGNNPLGLYLSQGKLKQDINLNDGNGNFYLKPNGWIGADTAGRVCVRSAEKYKAGGLWNAIQSGPMLVSDGQISKALGVKSQSRNIRCGVGELSDQGQTTLVFAKSDNPVSFFEFATLFQEAFKCDNALNLESGGFCMIHLPAIADPNPNPILHRYLTISL